MTVISLGTHSVGRGSPCLVIAEAGVNHNGDPALAHALIDAAVEAGAGCVKFQHFRSEDLVTAAIAKAPYQTINTGADGDQLTMLKALELPAERHAELKAHCDARGVLYLCTPYDPVSADQLAAIGVAGYKVASTDTTNTILLRHLAAKQRPLIVSTGMCDLADVAQAVNTLREGGMDGKVALLHCVAQYPAPVEQLNLRAMATLEQAFGWPVGFSDHSPGVDACAWAAALGASIVEKHFTLDRALPGPDHRVSLEPQELGRLVAQIRAVEAALGDGVKRIMPIEAPNRRHMQKSLVATRQLVAGAVLTAADIAAKRSSTGLAPAWIDRMIGQPLRVGLEADEPITLDAVIWGPGNTETPC